MCFLRQSIARCIFQLSRRDRELLPFSLMLRDEIENFFLSVSCFETRSRISSLQSHVSRRDREFLPFGLMLRDEIENFCLHSRASRRDREECLKKCTFVERWRPLFSKTSSLVKIVFLNFCFHFCQNVTF